VSGLRLGLAYDDVLIVPRRSGIASRREVSTRSSFTRRIEVAVPIVSASMDTVTESAMAIAMAQIGGIGAVHRFMPLEREAAEVARVKRFLNVVVDDPYRISPDRTVAEARAEAARHGVTGLLVTDGAGRLEGILTARDLRAEPDERPVHEAMTPRERLVTRSPTVSLEEAEQAMFENRVEKLPLVDVDGRIRGLVTMRDLKLYKQNPHSTKDAKGRLRVGAAIGATGDFLQRAEALLQQEVDVVLLDVAHADSDAVQSAVSALRGRFGRVPLVAGNVATGAAARWLAGLGVDAIKVGVGPGRGCRTRLETGAGVPQLQAVREAYLATEGKVPIIADGGVRSDKDIFLAIACGGSTVMLGSMLSGTDEAPGIMVEEPSTRQKMKLYRGMTSPEAVADGAEADELAEALRTPAEGQSVRVPYVGSVVGILARLRGHLRSAVSYAGEAELREAHCKIARDPQKYLIPLSDASRRESFVR